MIASGFDFEIEENNIKAKTSLSFLPLQINRAPSFGTDQKIDYDVKKGVLLNALKLLNIRYGAIRSPESH